MLKLRKTEMKDKHRFFALFFIFYFTLHNSVVDLLQGVDWIYDTLFIYGYDRDAFLGEPVETGLPQKKVIIIFMKIFIYYSPL